MRWGKLTNNMLLIQVQLKQAYSAADDKTTFMKVFSFVRAWLTISIGLSPTAAKMLYLSLTS